MPTLTLIPSKAAVQRGLAGFQQGKPLKISFRVGEKLEDPMHRFNDFRMPENQIQQLFKDSDLSQLIAMESVLGADLQLFVP